MKMKLEKWLAVAGVSALAFIAGDFFLDDSKRIGDKLNDCMDYIHSDRGVSGNSVSSVPGYQVFANKEIVFGLPVRCNVSIVKKDTNNKPLYGASAEFNGFKWTVKSNSLPEGERAIFNNPAKLFNSYWKEVY